MTALGRALMAQPSMILLDEPSMGLAPQIVEEIFEIVQDLNSKEGVSFLLAEQNTMIALRYANYGYILENGRVVMDGAASDLATNEDVKEFYLGLSSGGAHRWRRQALPPPQTLARVSAAASRPIRSPPAEVSFG
jgi:branched-chain amino acid transport system ATP-binding protein